jgi:small ligand-binding sensory domain FIST
MIATGFAQGAEPKPELAQQAVREAMAKLNASVANSVLLFLTPPFIRHLPATIRAAAAAANCIHVVGCVAAGVFTEQGAVLKTPAVAVLVLSGGLSLQHQVSGLILSLATPDDLSTEWLSAGMPRFGGISRGGVWRNGKGVQVSACEVALQGATGVVGVTSGIEYLGAPQPITAVQGHEVVFVGGKPALHTLQQVFHDDVLDISKLSFNQAYACLADSLEAAQHGQYRLLNLVGANAANRSVMLAQAAEAGQWLCWARSVPIQDGEKISDDLLVELKHQPDLALLFSCLGRSTGFGAANRDLSHLRQRFPAMPLIGIDTDAVIATIDGRNQMLQHAAVLGLFHV